MRAKAVWERDYHRVFLDLCVKQKLLGNKPGTHFSKEGWRNILESFQEKTGARYDRMQLKNHWDTMSRQWKIWCRLVQTSYMKWDPETNTFGATDQEWTHYLQMNPEAGQYRLSPPQDLKKLEIIFVGGNVVEIKDCKVLGVRKRRSSYHEEDEDSLSMSNSPQTKGYWSPSSHEMFLDLLVQETLKGNRPETHFNKEGWKTILETINEKSGIGYSRAQLKNHWDCTRKAWKIWCQLVGTSCMKWDPITCTFGATEEEWRIYLRENPRAGQFRHKQISHADKLAIIFHGVIQPGETYTPRKKLLHERSESSQLHDPAPLSITHIDDEAAIARINGGFAASQFHEDQITPIDIETGQRLEAIELRNNGTVNDQIVYSIGECIECLDAMKEVEQGSDVYLFALDMFLKREYREIFLQLKKPSLRLAWLRRLHSTGPAITT